MKKKMALLLVLLLIGSAFGGVLASAEELMSFPTGFQLPQFEVLLSETDATDPPDVVVNSKEELYTQFMGFLNRLSTRFTIQYMGADAEDVWREFSLLFKHPYRWQMCYGYHLLKSITPVATIVPGTSFTVTFKDGQYHHTEKQEQDLDADVVTLLNKLVGNKVTDYDKVKAVNDYVVLKTQYSDATVQSPHSSWTVFYEHLGVCQGYATLAFKMLEKWKIPTRFVRGTSNGVDHLWLMVELDGEWYHLDPTHNDPIYTGGYDSTNTVTYSSFLASDKKMLENKDSNYIWDRGYYPPAKSEKYADKNIGRYEYTKADFDWLNNEGGDFLDEAMFKDYRRFSDKVEPMGRSAWTIRFSENIVPASTTDKVFILSNQGKNGTKIETKLLVYGDKIRVSTTTDTPFPKGIYYLVIEKGIQGEKFSLAQPVFMKFTIE